MLLNASVLTPLDAQSDGSPDEVHLCGGSAWPDLRGKYVASGRAHNGKRLYLQEQLPEAAGASDGGGAAVDASPVSRGILYWDAGFSVWKVHNGAFGGPFTSRLFHCRSTTIFGRRRLLQKSCPCRRIPVFILRLTFFPVRIAYFWSSDMAECEAGTGFLLNKSASLMALDGGVWQAWDPGSAKWRPESELLCLSGDAMGGAIDGATRTAALPGQGGYSGGGSADEAAAPVKTTQAALAAALARVIGSPPPATPNDDDDDDDDDQVEALRAAMELSLELQATVTENASADGTAASASAAADAAAPSSLDASEGVTSADRAAEAVAERTVAAWDESDRESSALADLEIGGDFDGLSAADLDMRLGGRLGGPEKGSKAEDDPPPPLTPRLGREASAPAVCMLPRWDESYDGPLPWKGIESAASGLATGLTTGGQGAAFGLGLPHGGPAGMLEGPIVVPGRPLSSGLGLALTRRLLAATDALLLKAPPDGAFAARLRAERESHNATLEALAAKHAAKHAAATAAAAAKAAPGSAGGTSDNLTALDPPPDAGPLLLRRHASSPTTATEVSVAAGRYATAATAESGTGSFAARRLLAIGLVAK